MKKSIVPLIAIACALYAIPSLSHAQSPLSAIQNGLDNIFDGAGRQAYSDPEDPFPTDPRKRRAPVSAAVNNGCDGCGYDHDEANQETHPSRVVESSNAQESAQIAPNTASSPKSGNGLGPVGKGAIIGGLVGTAAGLGLYALLGSGLLALGLLAGGGLVAGALIGALIGAATSGSGSVKKSTNDNASNGRDEGCIPERRIPRPDFPPGRPPFDR